jgi:hypothetical protein
MRATNDTPIDPEIAAELDAIDATLAGDPVDPKYADVAELALLLVADRPEPRREFLDSLDGTVERRFASAPGTAGPSTVGGRWRRIQSWGTMPALGTAAAGLAAVVVALVVLTSGGANRSQSVRENLSLAPTPTGQSSSSGAGTARSAAGASASAGARAGRPNAVMGTLKPQAGSKRFAAPTHKAASSAPPAATTPTTTAGSSESGGSASGSADSSRAYAPASPTNGAAAGGSSSAQSLAAAPAPQPNGRKIVQSAQLALTTRPSHIDQVSQEVFNVVGNENGIVQRSSVTASGRPDSYAQFQLSIPSANLARTMAQLSKLQYAHVASRSDSTQDINHAFVSTRSMLGEQQALRTSLLKQLAAAYTQQAIDAIKARLHGVDVKIAALNARLKNLNHRVAYSQVQVTINASNVSIPVHHGHHSGGFTIGKALHDAGRVLTVAAGIALITAAVLVPVGLLGGIAGWIGAGVRRRRREHALDLA